MSSEEDKIKNSRRRQNDEKAIRKQTKIAKDTYHLQASDIQDLKEPHRMHKKHALDCGNPGCAMCGNPRHTHKHGRTKQEYSFIQTESWQE